MAPPHVPLVDAEPLLWRFGAARRRDAERVPLARAAGRVLAEACRGDEGVLPAGHRLGVFDLGRLAAAGHAEVVCVRRPTVALFTLGADRIPPGQALPPGGRHDAARPVLMAWLQAQGLEPVAWPVLPVLGSALDDAAQAFDLVLVAAAPGPDGLPAGLPPAAEHPSALRIDLGLTAPAVALLIPLEAGPRQPLCLFLPDVPEALRRACEQVLPPLLAGLLGEREPAFIPDTAAGDGKGGWPLEIEAAAVPRALAAGGRLIDLREPQETASGLPAGAEAVPRARLLAEPESFGAGQGPLLLICASGVRSLAAARALREAGIPHVASVRGGLVAWRAAGLAMQGETTGEPRLDADARERYARHLLLPQVGVEGQARLLASRVLLVGAGGLGSPAAFYLAAAGVGCLRLVDDDRVERSNLQRQILHVDAAVGQPKVASARERLLALNPRLQLETVQTRVDEHTVDALVADADVVLDGSDNFATRYRLNWACLRHRKPLVFGAVERFHGQVAVFDAGRRRGERPCYQCLFPVPPEAAAAPNCAEAGVLGVLPGVIGLLQATETLKLLLGQGDPLAGRLLVFDALTMRFRELLVQPDPGCPACGSGPGESAAWKFDTPSCSASVRSA